jgi:hypothetical protein
MATWRANFWPRWSMSWVRAVHVGSLHGADDDMESGASGSSNRRARGGEV